MRYHTAALALGAAALIITGCGAGLTEQDREFLDGAGLADSQLDTSKLVEAAHGFCDNLKRYERNPRNTPDEYKVGIGFMAFRTQRDYPVTRGLDSRFATSAALTYCPNLTESMFQRYQRATTPQPSDASPAPDTEPAGCPPGTSSGFGPGCQPPEQHQQAAEEEAAANAGPVEDSDGDGIADRIDGENDPDYSGCGQDAVNTGEFNPDCSEYQGYLDPGVSAGRGPSSADKQYEYGCEQGYIPEEDC